ncbi:hypothetical protein FH551_03080 [Salmonella enterica]|nr:hypothetical protein [Salmonella enterica]
MKFPGKRKSKHYFPVNARDPLLQQIQPEQETNASWVVGIDQTLVDIEAKVDDDFITRYGLSAGHSLVIEDEVAEKLYQELTRENLITHQFAGGTIGNTMHNYSVLADDRSVLLGVMCSNIEIGSYAYRYLCNTSSRTDLNYLQAVDGPIGRCFTLTGENDPLLAADKALDWVDLVLCTAGPIGLYMAGFTEEEAKRKTQHPLLPGAIAEFNQYEFSRAMRHKDCINPLRVYSHIAPYMGGPEKIMNTNGAGDGALAALLHDITANSYHRSNVPNSSKHKFTWLTYSSLAQVCKYANRVSYQVLNQHSPRLTRGLPEREDSLEESYWDR